MKTMIDGNHYQFCINEISVRTPCWHYASLYIEKGCATLYNEYAPIQSAQSISNQVLNALRKPKLTDNDKAKIIAEGFAQFETLYLNFDNLAIKSDLKETEHTLKSDLRKTESKLTKEIEAIRREIEAIRLETKNLEVKLIREIKTLEVKLISDNKNLEVKLISEISQSSRTTIKWVTGLMLTMVIALASLILMQ